MISIKIINISQSLKSNFQNLGSMTKPLKTMQLLILLFLTMGFTTNSFADGLEKGLAPLQAHVSISNQTSVPAPIDLSVHVNGESTTGSYVYIEDDTHALTIEDVASIKSWLIPEANTVNRGFSDAPSWMKFTLQNPSDSEKALILEYIDASAATIDVYHRSAGSDAIFQHQSFEFTSPVDIRPISFYRPAFSVDIPGNNVSEIYIRIFQGNDFPMHSFSSFRVWEEKAFYRAAHIELLLLIILLCTEVFMGIATVVAYFSTRDKVFLYYAAFAFSAASLFSALSGLWGYFVSPQHYELWMVVLQINICQIAAVLFVRKFLNIAEYLPTIDKVLLLVVAIDTVGVILNLFGQPYFSRIIIDYTAISYFFLAPIGLYAHKKQVPHALLFTGSWVVFVIGMALASLRYRGYIADTALAEWLIYFGGFVEVFLLTTVMILRINDMQKEKRRIEESHRLHLENAAMELSFKVEQQTKQLQEAKIKAEQEARTDLLTGLANRRSFFEGADQFIERAKRQGPDKLYLLMIDIDHFKNINDTYGHAAGDVVLKDVATTLTHTLRNIDLVARLGGEEFAVVMENSSIETAKALTERVRESVENVQSRFEDKSISVTISVGLVAWNASHSLHVLMQKADNALYKAKEQGRNRTIFA